MDLVRALLVFGADVNKRNEMGVTVRHLVATQTKDWKLLRTLSEVGALRCIPWSLSSSNSSTSSSDGYNHFYRLISTLLFNIPVFILAIGVGNFEMYLCDRLHFDQK